MKKYKQLTLEQRYHISALRKAGLMIVQVAKELGITVSTVFRELRRNSSEENYDPEKAHKLAQQRKIKASTGCRITQEQENYIRLKIKLKWSPEQVSERMRYEGHNKVSHEAIYQLIKRDKELGGDLYLNLRHVQKKRKKRYGSVDKRGVIKNRVSIDERPKEVENKERIGDWEIDCMIGKGHAGVLVTMVERVSKKTLIAQAQNKTAEAVTKSILKVAKKFAHQILTITSDNGKEFSLHEKIAQSLGSDFYFAHPYSSWERGLNENTNGLIRQFFPKNRTLDNISDEEVDFVMENLNSRPRKTLGFLTPDEVFGKFSFIALQT